MARAAGAELAAGADAGAGAGDATATDGVIGPVAVARGGVSAEAASAAEVGSAR
jgi:hypothetical protein